MLVCAVCARRRVSLNVVGQQLGEDIDVQGDGTGGAKGE